MGSHTHTIVVALSFNEKELIDTVSDFSHRRKDELDGILLGPYVGINSITSYVFMPHGSKDGWPESEKMDNLRNQFIEAVKRVEFVEIIETVWGDHYDKPIASSI